MNLAERPGAFASRKRVAPYSGLGEWLWLYFAASLAAVTALGGVVVNESHRFLQLDIGLSSGQNLAHPSDIVLKDVFVQGLRNLHPTNERECRNVHTAIGDLGHLAHYNWRPWPLGSGSI